MSETIGKLKFGVIYLVVFKFEDNYYLRTFNATMDPNTELPDNIVFELMEEQQGCGDRECFHRLGKTAERRLKREGINDPYLFSQVRGMQANNAVAV